MKAYYQREQRIGVSMCDSLGRLGVANSFALFQDVASEHAELLGVGLQATKEQGVFWVTARSRVHFYARPAMMRSLQLSTWPASPGSMRCDRFYRLADGEEPLIEGRTEWCVVNIESGRPVPPAGMFPGDIEYIDAALLGHPYARYRHDFSDADIAASCTVQSSDVDVGRHMNNVSYLRLICNSFSVAELEEMEIEEMEIWFCMPCFEGDRLDILRRKTDTGYEFGVRRPDRRYAALAQLRLKHDPAPTA